MWYYPHFTCERLFCLGEIIITWTRSVPNNWSNERTRDLKSGI